MSRIKIIDYPCQGVKIFTLFPSYNKNVGLEVGLKKTEQKVIELLLENPSATSDELAAKIGVTKRTVERTYKTLQEKKMIQRLGSRRNGS